MRARTRLLIFLFAAAVFVGCTEEISPTGPEIDPLVGTWKGTWTTMVESTTPNNSLTLTVRTGGEGTATGEATYVFGQDQIVEIVGFEFVVSPGGDLTGTGTFVLWIVTSEGYGYGEAAGTLTGILDPADGSGAGTLALDLDGTPHEVIWQVSKEVE